MSILNVFFESDQQPEPSVPEKAPLLPIRIAHESASASDIGLETQIRRRVVITGQVTTFATTLEGLREFIPDEEQRIKAALKTMGQPGAAALRVELSALIDRLKNEAEKFSLAAVNKRQNTVDLPRQKAKAIAAEISQLSVKIGQLKTEQDQMENQANIAESDIQATSDSFTASIGALTDEYQSIIDKIS